MANFVDSKNESKRFSLSSGSKSYVWKPLVRSPSLNQWKIGKRTSIQVGSFLIKTIALEAVRRFSRARYPFIWTGLQALQVFCYPPLKWIQRWNPFGVFVKSMQMLSRPLLLLSIVDALSDHSDCSNSIMDDSENYSHIDDSQLESDSQRGTLSIECNHGIRVEDETSQGLLTTGWLCNLHEELNNQGITLPERINQEELQRFYVAANSDFATLLQSVKKTIHWRETYRILSGEELEVWSSMIFWHGSDVTHRPCLVVRLGMACSSLQSRDKPQFVQAVVSQVEHGVMYLVNEENPQITVIVDCQGLSPMKIPMQMMRHCCNLLQDHFPNVLGCLIVVRLPPVVRVIAQTFIQVLKPVTRQKLRIEGEAYQEVLSELFPTLPSYLGGLCNCTSCAKVDASSIRPRLDSSTAASEAVAKLGDSHDVPSTEPTYEYEAMTDNSCNHILRTAIIGILIVWVLIAFIEGIYDPASRPVLPQ